MMFTISPRQLPFLGGFSPAFQEKVEKAKAAPAPAVPKESKPEKAAQSHWAWIGNETWVSFSYLQGGAPVR